MTAGQKQLDYLKLKATRSELNDNLLNALTNAFLAERDVVVAKPRHESPKLEALSIVVETHENRMKNKQSLESTWEVITKMFRQVDMTNNGYLDMVIYNLLNTISIPKLQEWIQLVKTCYKTEVDE